MLLVGLTTRVFTPP